MDRSSCHKWGGLRLPSSYCTPTFTSLRGSHASDPGSSGMPLPSFASPYARFDDMFVGGMPPSHELLQAHLKANTSMSAAMTLLRGGPVDAWRWRYIRVKQEKQEVVEIIRDVIQKQQQQTGGGLTNRHAPARWAELPRSVGWRQHAGTQPTTHVSQQQRHDRAGSLPHGATDGTVRCTRTHGVPRV